MRTIFTNTFKLFALLSGCLWLGVYISRMLISYQLFDIDLNLMSYISDQNLEAIFVTITPVINATFILYTLFIIAFTVFLFLSKMKLKENGWLFIIVLIVYITLPFEAYLMIIDYNLVTQLNFSETINSSYIIDLIKERFVQLNGFPWIIILSYCTIIFMLLFKPFSSAAKNEN